jgi:hypothetical protein
MEPTRQEHSKTPLDVAHESGAGELVQWLLNTGAKRADALK